MYAARNIRLCSKDCLCLFVCPTGATDTEDGTIDPTKCLDGCRLCVDACPSHAIYLVQDRYPTRPILEGAPADRLASLLAEKASMHVSAGSVEEDPDSPVLNSLMKALAASNKVLAEDCVREAGFLVPQTEAFESLIASGFLQKLYTKEHGNADALEAILNRLSTALNHREDAEPGYIAVCTGCGSIILDESVSECPSCRSGNEGTLLKI